MQADYTGAGLVNLVASLVLVIIDGLGDNYLMGRGAGGELARRRRNAITSVFPSTTASAITTSYTGRTPLRTRGENVPLREKGFSPQRAFSVCSIFSSLPVRSIVVTYRQIVDSDYNLRHCDGAERSAYDSVDEFVDRVETAVKSGGERKFVYAYLPQYDVVSHRHGAQSAQAAAEFASIDDAFGRMLARLSGTDTAVVATADHGFIDVAPDESLELPSSLACQLRLPLCGERRVVYCHVHDVERFMEKAKDWLGERADVRPSRELAEEGWFGPGAPHPRFPERIGEVTLVMRGHYTVKDWTPGEPRHLHIGNHGGTSEDEMLIPLILERA
jgi:type I phosphodiesterase/nucleotide pyrophosphatase